MGQYEVKAHSTGIFGRVLCSCRNHHFVVDGPVANGCPGEVVTSAEQFIWHSRSCDIRCAGRFPD